MTANVQASRRHGWVMKDAATVIPSLQPGRSKCRRSGLGGGLLLFDVRARSPLRPDGYGYCERLQWHTGRWMSPPGSHQRTPRPPGRAAVSIRAGWRAWVGAAEDERGTRRPAEPVQYLAGEAGKIFADGWTRPCSACGTPALGATADPQHYRCTAHPGLSENGPGASCTERRSTRRGVGAGRIDDPAGSGSDPTQWERPGRARGPGRLSCGRVGLGSASRLCTPAAAGL
jgi:hypothetical protein